MMVPESSNFNLRLSMIGDALILASIQISIASYDMSSKYSVKNFSTTQIILDNAGDALYEYIKTGIMWTVITSILMFLNFGFEGLAYTLFANILIMLWIYFSYIKAFEYNVEKYNLKMPSVF